MKNQITVRASWDDEAKVWVATSDDIRGLAVEAPGVEGLMAKVIPAIQDLLELNGAPSDLPAEIPVWICAEQHASIRNPCL